jgi:putative peptidoglycan lipid II flippase
MLIGSAVGLLVATMGRLYQSTLYALHDTKTPFRIAMMRVAVGAALALAFTFPFRGFFPAVIDMLRLPRPRVVGGPAALAIIGITFASAVASWIEYSLLRRAVGKRIGYGAPKALHFTKLWLAAVAAGIVSDVFDVLLGARIARHLPLPHVFEFLLAAGAFGAVYFGIGWLLGVEEVRTTLGRVFKKLR